jgi:hypothetical protein
LRAIPQLHLQRAFLETTASVVGQQVRANDVRLRSGPPHIEPFYCGSIRQVIVLLAMPH